jgi:hypothetical protein
VADNPVTPAYIRPFVLTSLAGDANKRLRRSVAANLATPPSTLAVMAVDEDSDVRCRIAANPAAFDTTLVQLAVDLDPKVRCAIARNPTTPADLLNQLVCDRDSDVRWAVAANPASPRASLAALAGDLSWRVCLAAISNSNAPVDILSAPTGDADADARRAGARRCAELRYALAAESPTPKQSAFIQSWIDELQAGLAEPVELKDLSNSEFRLAFDALGLMPPEGDKRAIAKAAKSKDWLERAAATYAPGIQPSLLKVLLEDPVEAVRQCAVARLRVVVA